jgi:hypothetical protein
VAGLPDNTSEARHALHERACAAFFSHLSGVALSKADIVGMRLSLEEAIQQVEAESAHAVSYSIGIGSRLLWLSALLTLYTGWDYFRAGLR